MSKSEKMMMINVTHSEESRVAMVADGMTSQEILEEEQRHLRLGPSLLRAEVKRCGPKRVQRGVAKWWRMGLNFFSVGARDEWYVKLGLLPRSADERLAAFQEDLAPHITDAGLAMPRLVHRSFPYL